MSTSKKQKPRLSFWQIWNMSFGFFGIQMGFALQNANVSRIFQTLGAEIEDIPILWVAAPLTGLIVQPIIGYLSDRTWHPKWGRRRPFFFIGALLASAALLYMPNSPVLWVAAGMLWIMDASINISMEPFRAFVGDNLPDSQRTMGFAMQSFFIGAGAYLASKLPTFLDAWGVSNTAAEGMIPDTVKYAFYIGAAAFIVTVLWTVFSSKEYSPEEIAEFEGEEEEFVADEKTSAWHAQVGKKQFTIGMTALALSAITSYLIFHFGLKKELYLASIVLIGGGGLAAFISGRLQLGGKIKSGFVQMMNDIHFMPNTMKDLAWVQFFSWFALFSMWIYTTGAVTSDLLGTTDTTSELYNKGANYVGNLFANYNLIAAIVAFLLPVIAAKSSRRFTHFLALLCGGVGLAFIFMIKNPTALTLEWLPAIGIGIAWASILSMPYAMLSAAIPVKKMGYYMGVFNFFIVIPQLVAASILGFLVGSIFQGKPIYALLIGGISMILAGFLSLRVKDVHGQNE